MEVTSMLLEANVAGSPSEGVPLRLWANLYGVVKPETDSNFLTPGGTVDERFTYEMFHYERNKVFFKNYNGKYVGVRQGHSFFPLTAVLDAPDATCYFELISGKDGWYFLKGSNGKYVKTVNGIAGFPKDLLCAVKDGDPDEYCLFHLCGPEHRLYGESAPEWSYTIHQKIFDKALLTIDWHKDKIREAPKAVAMLKAQQEEIKKGITAADAEIKHSKVLYAGHFYDPDTGNNYLVDFWPKIADTLRMRDTALSNARDYYFMGVSKHDAHNLGLAIHFISDILCPFHAANFIEYNNRLFLDRRHSGFETYAENHADEFFWEPSSLKPEAISPDVYLNPINTLHSIAKSSKAFYTDKPVELRKIVEGKMKGPISFDNVWTDSEAKLALQKTLPAAQVVISLLMLHFGRDTIN